jgi:hypothetical protein
MLRQILKQEVYVAYSDLLPVSSIQQQRMFGSHNEELHEKPKVASLGSAPVKRKKVFAVSSPRAVVVIEDQLRPPL